MHSWTSKENRPTLIDFFNTHRRLHKHSPHVRLRPRIACEIAIFRHLFEKQSEHKESESQSTCDPQESATDSYSAFETCGSLASQQYAIPSQAIKHTHESEGNRKEWEQLHA
jgi:hypothetical protein